MTQTDSPLAAWTGSPQDGTPGWAEQPPVPVETNPTTTAPTLIQTRTGHVIRPGEAVNHPQHYNDHPAGVECIDVVEHMSFNVGNAMKYMWRAGLKPGAEHKQDLEKAVWYLQREIARVTGTG